MSVGMGIGGFFEARSSNDEGLFLNRWTSLMSGVLCAVVILGAFWLIILQVHCLPLG